MASQTDYYQPNLQNGVKLFMESEIIYRSSEIKNHPLIFEPSIFENELNNFDITEEDRIELLNLLWDMMVACADMGWGIEPTQVICTRLIQSAFDDKPKPH